VEATVENALSMLQDAGFKLKEMVKVYHFVLCWIILYAHGYSVVGGFFFIIWFISSFGVLFVRFM